MKLVFALATVLVGATLAPGAEPIRLHPDNPHYFSWRGRPTVLITSAEHYGAVLNLEFDYIKYLDTLARDGLNLTRTFSGAYCENPTAFNIANNTLAPATGRLIVPWSRSNTPGYFGGGNKFDLTRWDEAYFRRLKDFVDQASRRGIVVEFTFFCPFYRDDMWLRSPLHAGNNVNGVGDVKREVVYTLDRHGGLLAVQEAMVRRIVAELRDADNVLWEVCNEPYTGKPVRLVAAEWENHMADIIADAERRIRGEARLPARLITQNIANGRQKIEQPHPAVSVFNFHYANPPDAVPMNFGLNRVIGDNETGFKGNADAHYRMEAWEFLLAGGALYNNLDYSFTVGHEDGTFAYGEKTPGGGNAGFRRQMKVLADFMRSFDFVRMGPDSNVVKSGLPEKARVQALVEPGRQYAIYLKGKPLTSIVVDLPSGSYHAEWISVMTGKGEGSRETKHAGGPATLEIPAGAEEIALRIRRS
ncbi:MAG: hypothetical protein Q7S40_18030 [Opitutaceae bacterium]|nr:hypothetical protein [Opitutaceae bacterium]